MPHLSIAKVGFTGTNVGRREIVLRNQGNTVYDIYKVRWIININSLVLTNERTSGALSTRLEDQADDSAQLSEESFMEDTGLFAAVAFISDFDTEGAAAMVGAHEIDYPVPFRVPFASFVVNIVTGAGVTIGAEIYFVRIEVPPIEKATLVRIQAGGRTRTS